MPYMTGSPLSIIAVLIVTFIGMIAQTRVQSTFEKYSKVFSSSGMTGADVARKLLQDNGCEATGVQSIAGALTDHFDPRTNIVSLSQPVYGATSISAQAVAAHECGHVMQHEQGYAPINLRSMFVPVANLGSTLSMPIFLAGLLFSFPLLISVGIAFFSFAVLFHLVTLPVEFNASSRALKALEKGGYLQSDEISSAKAVLDAAAMTYVAAALASAVQLLRLISIANNRRR